MAPSYPVLYKNSALVLHILTKTMGLAEFLFATCVNSQTLSYLHRVEAVCLLMLTIETRDCEGIYLQGWAIAMGSLNSCVTFICVSGFDY